MNYLIALIISFFTGFSAFAMVDCNTLSGDAVSLCRQNKRILRKLNNQNNCSGSGQTQRIQFFDEANCTDEWAMLTLRGAPKIEQCEALARRLRDLSDSHSTIESVSIDGECSKVELNRKDSQEITDYCLTL